MPASDATCVAAIAFPEGNWEEELAALRAVCDPLEVIEIAAGKGLSGICNVVAAMDPERVKGVGEVIARMPALNQRIAVTAAETPLRDLGIGYQCVICHPDIISAMLATSEGVSHSVHERIENEVAQDIKEGATVYIFVQPRRSSKSTPVSLNFTLLFARAETLFDARMIESYNFMKGNGIVTAEKLKSHWKKHGIERPGPRPPASKFELLFASVPDNSKLAATDLTHLGSVERDRELLGSTVFSIAANKPGTVIYQCDKVLCLEVDVQAHRALEVLHRLGEQAYIASCGTSFGLHTGPSS